MNEEQMILDNTPLIYESIKQLHLTWETEDEWQDYYGNGLIGLIKGVRSFDESKGLKLSTFLMPCIMNEIKHHLTIKTAEKRTNENGKDVSLNAIVGDEEDSELLDFIEDNKVNIEEEVEKKLQLEAVVKELNSMENKKDALVIKMYYGLDGYIPKTYDEISKEFGVSREMIRQRITRGIERLKKRSKFIERKVFMEERKTAVETASGEILVFKDKEDKNKNVLEQVNDVLLEQLVRLKKLDMDDKETSKLEIARSNAISSTSKTILQTIGIQMMAEKQKYKFLQIGND